MSIRVSAAQLRAWRDAGLTLHEVAAEIGSPYITVWKAARSFGIDGWKRRTYAQGIAASENSRRALAIGRAIQREISRLSLVDYERYVHCRRLDPHLTPSGALTAVRAMAEVRHA